MYYVQEARKRKRREERRKKRETHTLSTFGFRYVVLFHQITSQFFKRVGLLLVGVGHFKDGNIPPFKNQPTIKRSSSSWSAASPENITTADE